MVVIFTDAEIAELLREPKELPEDYRSRLQVKGGRAQRRADLFVDSRDGHRFCIKVRQAEEDSTNFSVLLLYCYEHTNSTFRLLRYNGWHGGHRNLIEGTRLSGPHRHIATERYQVHGSDPDGYAEDDSRYNDVWGALRCLIEDAGFVRPPNDQLELLT